MASKYKRYEGRESDFQITLAQYLDSLGVLWYHCPNGGTRNYKEAARLKREGVKSGVPDVTICEARHGFHGFYLELKVKYNSTSDNQIEFLQRLEANGYKTAVTKSLDEAIDLIDEYLKPRQYILKVDPDMIDRYHEPWKPFKKRKKSTK